MPPPSPPKKEVQLLGPRPSPLRVAKESHAIRKPPRHPPPQHAAGPSAASVAAAAAVEDRQQPTIIFDISPKVIHVEERNFMSIVQQLTGSSSGDLSPAARLAAIERTSPTGREKGFAGAAATAEMVGSSARAGDDELMGMLEELDLRQIQGILSPAPAALPTVSAGMFSPATDPHVLQDLSPYWAGNFSYNSPSASTLFTALSPSPTSGIDLFNLFSNF
ncbi:hypothetical protein NL676_014125 [Syzygium grande]|nr:hypothetical protein NL676_014125 [Syzygium grande]